MKTNSHGLLSVGADKRRKLATGIQRSSALYVLCADRERLALCSCVAYAQQAAALHCDRTLRMRMSIKPGRGMDATQFSANSVS